MHLKIKDPKGVTKIIEIEPSASVAAFRELVTKEYQIGSPTQVRMISKGKLLSDDNTVESSGLQNDDIIMILVTKAKDEKQLQQQSEEEAHKTEIDIVIQEGYERDEAVGALRQHGWNTVQALQFLADQDESQMQEDDISAIGLLAMTQEQIDELGDDELDQAIDEAIEIFLMAPQFRSIREQIRSNPGSLENVQEQIRQINPAFYGLIVDNPTILEEILIGVNELTEDQIANVNENGSDWEDVSNFGLTQGGTNNMGKYLEL